MSPADSEIRMIPVTRLRVLNPRVRDKRKFAGIVKNIGSAGLKRPITVRECPGKDGEEAYEVVCGQGRLEAYLALGQSHIPAIVRPYEKKAALLASLVENVARRSVRAIDQIESIRWMQQQGHSADEIGRKTGLAGTYVAGILRLLEHGETRLLDAVLHNRIPITIATQIAWSKDNEVQQVLMDAYEGKEINQKTLGVFRKLVQQRKTWGKGYDPKFRS